MANYKISIFTSVLLLCGCVVPNQRVSDNIRQTSLHEAINNATATQLFLKEKSEEAALQAAKDKVAYGLKDPSSAQFRNVKLIDYAKGKVFCGEVNAKNSYGAYVGFKRFIASPIGAYIESNTENSRLYDQRNSGLDDACRY